MGKCPVCVCAAADGQLSCSAFLCFLSVFFRSACGCVFIVLGVLKVCALRSLCVIGLCVAVGWATIATLLTFSLCLSRGLMGVWPDVMTQTLRVLQVHTEAVSVTLLCQTHFCFSEYSYTYSNVCLIHFTVSKSINHAKKHNMMTTERHTSLILLLVPFPTYHPVLSCSHLYTVCCRKIHKAQKQLIMLPVCAVSVRSHERIVPLR